LHYKDPVGYDSSNFGVRFFKFLSKTITGDHDGDAENVCISTL